jgi:hypothetical protein
MLVSIFGSSQTTDTYLVVKDNANNSTIQFPGTTDLKLYRNDSLVLTREQMVMNKKYEIKGEQQVILDVSWSDEPKSMTLQDTYIQLKQETANKKTVNNEIPVDLNKEAKSLEEASRVRLSFKSITYIDGYYNAIMKFSNGITFKYIDGRVSIDQNGKSLPYEKKYVVETNDGIFKLSYDPLDAETWFVFEPKK